MAKKYQVYYINDWGNPVFLFFGTLEECQKFYDDHIGYCDSKDAMIDVKWKGAE